MTNYVQKTQDDSVCMNRSNGSRNGFFSVRSLSNYVRIVSSGASNVASSVRTAGASIISSMSNGHDDSGHDQVLWAGFDKLESEDDVLRQVLLLAYKSGFQVWDVEQADDVRQLESRHDASASFLQIQKKPFVLKGIVDRFAGVRPLLIVVGDGILTTNINNCGGFSSPNGLIGGCQDIGRDSFLPTFVHFYSLKTHAYVHVLKFRSAVFSVRCSPRVIAVSQTSQIHCLNSATLEREYTILTHPVVSQSPDSGSIGYGPLAVGARWLAYSGNSIAVSINPVSQVVSPATVSHSTGSLVANFARESSKKLAAGFMTVGDIGYITLNKYYSDIVGDGNVYTARETSNFKSNGTLHRKPPDLETCGLVIVRDIASRSIIVQFMAHKSPISALSFDPSGTLLVTASVHGHNVNVFHIIPSCGDSEGSDAKGSCIHLYKLRRGITNAVIQDISFSDDSKWIMISSSRGTSHLFAIGSVSVPDILINKSNFLNSCYGSGVKDKTSVHLHYISSKITEQNLFAYGNPVTLSAVSRIKNGNPWLKSTAISVAATAAGKVGPISGAIASVFHHCKTTGFHHDPSSFRAMYYLLVFAPSGSIVQYVLRPTIWEGSSAHLSRLVSVAHDLSREPDARFVVEALQKCDLCHKQNRRDRCDNVVIYGDHGDGGNAKILQEGIRNGTSAYPSGGTDMTPKSIPRETHHLYLSEVELHSHKDLVPLWAKSEFCFEVLMDQNGKETQWGNSFGEMEIEGIPFRTIETRSRDLIPVFNSVSTKIQQLRTDDSDTRGYVPVCDQKLELSEASKNCRSSCNSVVGKNEKLQSDSAHETEGFVNNLARNGSMNSEIDFVNNSEDHVIESDFTLF